MLLKIVHIDISIISTVRENGKLPQHMYERIKQKMNKATSTTKKIRQEEEEEEKEKEETHEAISSLLSAEYVTEKAQKWSFCCGRRSSE